MFDGAPTFCEGGAATYLSFIHWGVMNMTLIAITAARSLENVEADLIHSFHQGMERLQTLICHEPPFEFVMFGRGFGEQSLWRYLTGKFDPKINRDVELFPVKVDDTPGTTFSRLNEMLAGCDGLIALDDDRDPEHRTVHRSSMTWELEQAASEFDDEHGPDEDTGTSFRQRLVDRDAKPMKHPLQAASRWVLDSTRIASTWNIPAVYVRLGNDGQRVSDWRKRTPKWAPSVYEPTQFVPEPLGGWPGDRMVVPA